MECELYWEELFINYFQDLEEALEDASHDLSHFRRVYLTAKQIASLETENTDPLVVLAAAYFHDVVTLPKNDPNNNLSSRYASKKAQDVLLTMDFPAEKIPAICHAIETHSFSAGLEPTTLEAKIIQDADRMESLGALGIMRTFYVSGRLKREPYDSNDLYAERRPLDDKSFGLDHFYVKLLKLPNLLKTLPGKFIANKRAEFLHSFIQYLDGDIKTGSGGALIVVSSCCDAGRRGSKLFDPLDPMAENRPLAPSVFALDQIIEKHDLFSGFITQFLDQLRSELEPCDLTLVEK